MRRIVTVCAAVSALAWTLALWRWRSAIPVARAFAYDVPRLNASAGPHPDVSGIESTLVANDMFRSSFDGVSGPSAIASGGGALPSKGVRPTLLVKGIIGGPPWQAIVDGIPGQPAGAVVQSGATYGSVFVASVGRDSVRIRAADTTITLFLRKSP